MENKNIYLLIAAFVMIIVGTSLIGVIATQGQTVTTKVNVADEALVLAANNPGEAINVTAVYTVTNAPTGWKSAECPITNFVLTNDSGYNINSANYTLTASTGKFKLLQTITLNTTSGMNESLTGLVDYTYCPEGYITEGWSRTVLNLVPGFFALALIGIGIALMFGIMKNEGILNI